MELGIIVTVGILALALGIVLGRYAWPSAHGVDPTVLTKAQMEAAQLGQECSSLRSRTTQLEAESKTATADVKTAAEEIARLSERAENLSKQLEEQSTLNLTLEDQRHKAASDVAQLKEREIALNEKINTLTRQLGEQQKQLTTEFENIANRILKANASELSEGSQKTIASILNPLRERIQEFQQKMESTYQAETRDVLSLKEQIKVMVETSHSIGSQADGLAKALRGDSQMRGRSSALTKSDPLPLS
jgi:DNA recombination protein RmuC